MGPQTNKSNKNEIPNHFSNLTCKHGCSKLFHGASVNCRCGTPCKGTYNLDSYNKMYQELVVDRIQTIHSIKVKNVESNVQPKKGENYGISKDKGTLWVDAGLRVTFDIEIITDCDKYDKEELTLADISLSVGEDFQKEWPTGTKCECGKPCQNEYTLNSIKYLFQEIKFDKNQKVLAVDVVKKESTEKPKAGTNYGIGLDGNSVFVNGGLRGPFNIATLE